LPLERRSFTIQNRRMPSSADPTTPTFLLRCEPPRHWLGDDGSDNWRDWTGFVERAKRRIQANHGHTQAGDPSALICTFQSAQTAASAALAVQKSAGAFRPSGPRLPLALALVDNVEGGAAQGTQLQLISLAQPGEILATPGIRDRLVDGLDAELEDLGDCFLKHHPHAFRAFRLFPTSAQSAPHLEAPAASDMPWLTVVPLSTSSNDPAFGAVGDLLADRVIAALSRSSHIRITSRLTASAFQGREEGAAMVGEHTRARYVLSGSYKVVGRSLEGLLSVKVELTDTHTLEVVWGTAMRASVGELLSLESELVHALATGAHHAILQCHVDSQRQDPITSLSNYALMLGGVTLMHRSAPTDFDNSRRWLEELQHRDPSMHIVSAWLAKWYVLQVTRGLTSQPQQQAPVALSHARRARESSDARSLGMAMEGFVQLHLLRDFRGASRLLEEAKLNNPSESLAWLFDGVAHTFLDQAQEALLNSQQAIRLSPMDPLLYYYESLAASSAIIARRYEDAVRLCQHSLRRNRVHAHTHRALITAHWLAGHPQQARSAALALLRLAPEYSVDTFERTASSAGTPFGRSMAEALREAGVPAR